MAESPSESPLSFASSENQHLSRAFMMRSPAVFSSMPSMSLRSSVAASQRASRLVMPTVESFSAVSLPTSSRRSSEIDFFLSSAICYRNSRI